jgi:hypothetical protein
MLRALAATDGEIALDAGEIRRRSQFQCGQGIESPYVVCSRRGYGVTSASRTNPSAVPGPHSSGPCARAGNVITGASITPMNVAGRIMASRRSGRFRVYRRSSPRRSSEPDMFSRQSNPGAICPGEDHENLRTCSSIARARRLRDTGKLQPHRSRKRNYVPINQ